MDRRALSVAIALAATLGGCHKAPKPVEAPPPAPRRIVEGYPLAVAKALQARRTAVAQAAKGVRQHPYSVIVEQTRRWSPGQTVRVAFRGGDPALYAKIEATAKAWTQPGYAKLNLVFRRPDGAFNSWSPTDQTAATGRWSVATASIPPWAAGQAGPP